MRPSIKGALFSGLVLPGLGQIYLKYYFRGICYILTTIICVCLVGYKILSLLNLIFNNIMQGANGVIDLNIAYYQIHQILKNQHVLPYEIAGYLSMVIWIASTIEAYYLGLKKEKSLVTPPTNTTKNNE